MKQTEKDKLIEAVRKKVQKNGIPINVRTGGNDEADREVDDDAT